MMAAPVDPSERRVAALRSAVVRDCDMRDLTEAGGEIAEAAGERAFDRGKTDAAEDQQHAEKSQENDAHALVRRRGRSLAPIGGDAGLRRKMRPRPVIHHSG